MNADLPCHADLGRLVRPADYVRVLGTPVRLRSTHFAIHHVPGRPLPSRRAAPSAETGTATAPCPPDTASLSTELSTGLETDGRRHVDDLRGAATGDGPEGRWLGLVVPKRHARRAVTRALLKRQIRQVVRDCAGRLAPGLWVVRQRAPFDPTQFRSAASEALKDAARGELQALLARAVEGEREVARSRSPAHPERGGPGPAGGATPAKGSRK